MPTIIRSELYTSWIPKGRVELNSKIFASCIPAPSYEKISADLLRKISNSNSWRYENLGDADDLITSSTILTDLPETQSKTGTAFCQTTRAKCFDIPATDEIWIKFDVYFGDENRWRAYNGGSGGDCGACSYGSSEFDLVAHGSYVREVRNTLTSNTLQTILLHMISGTSNGVVEAWIDGVKIYTYTGDVNNGADFSDIYLQSDGSGTFFSNVIISNAEIGLDENVVPVVTYDIRIKPEVYASWIPKGEVNLNSELYVSFIPTPEKTTGDLLRRTGSSTPSNVDLLRRVAKTESVSADTTRAIVRAEKSIADTSRKIGLDIARADLSRKVKGRVKNKFDTCIKCGVVEKISADTERGIATFEKFSADTFLQIAIAEKVPADLLRSLRDIFKADLSRKVTRKEKTVARTVIRIPHILNYFVQSPPLLSGKKTKAGLLRNDISNSLINTFQNYNVTAINITLAERTLSDTFTVELVDDNINIGDTVSIYLLDYPFDFRVEEITYRDSARSIKGIYNCDEQLYTWFQMPYGDDGDNKTKDYYPTAINALQEIAADLGLTADIRIGNFTPTNLQAGEFVTYSDVINSLFSWTSSVASRQINVFIRGKTLYAIQRGEETKTFDITDLPHSRPTINQKFNRVLCHNPNNDDTDDDDDKPKFSGTILYQQIGVAPFNARFYVSLTYSSGLLTNEHTTMQTGMFESDGEILIRSQTTRTGYGYETFTPSTGEDTQYYLSSKQLTNETKEQNMTTKEITSNKTETDTVYHYETLEHGEALYLFHEAESSTTTTKDGDDTEITRTTRDTYHFPAGNGFYAQAVYQNGVLQGANISQGAPSNNVSPYTVDQMQANFFSAEIIEEPDDFTDQLSAIVDYSFPIKEKAIKDQLNKELKQLHHKIVETVTLDLVSKIVNGVPEINHIVDFTERISFNGNEYFLVSNNISFTPRKLIQTLQLIRWF